MLFTKRGDGILTLGIIKNYSGKKSSLNQPTKSQPLQKIKRLARELQQKK